MPNNQSNSPTNPAIFRVGVCGSTARTVQCAQALATDPRFTIDWVITPPPRPVGRTAHLTASPLEVWANQQPIPVIHIDRGLWPQVKNVITGDQHPNLPALPPAPHFLLVVDFGFIVPPWLLAWPQIAPINIHPSRLPEFRGSAPAPWALMSGATTGAISVMRMDAGLDTGPVIAVKEWPLPPDVNAAAYYEQAFALLTPALADILATYAHDKQEQAQPLTSPTPIARRLERVDGFVPWELVQTLMTSPQPAQVTWTPEIMTQLSPLWREIITTSSAPPAILVERATRALTPWPGVWTIIPTYKNRHEVRVKILAIAVKREKSDDHHQMNKMTSWTITRWQPDGENIKNEPLRLRV